MCVCRQAAGNSRNAMVAGEQEGGCGGGAAATAARPLGPAGRAVAAQCRGDMMPPASVAVGEGGWALTNSVLEYRDAIRDLEVRPSDVWILSFPKCGEQPNESLTSSKISVQKIYISIKNTSENFG